MKQCYAIFAKENDKGPDLAAVADDDVDITEPLYTMVSGDNTLLHELSLKSVASTRKGLAYSDDISQFEDIWLDMLVNDFAVPLFSEKLKRFFDEEIDGNGYMKWIKVKIDGLDETNTYYAPEFTEKLDVLNLGGCSFNEYDNSIVVPCFSYEKIRKYVLFHQPDDEEYLWRTPHSVHVSDGTRKKLIANKFTGMCFEKVRTSE